MLLGESNARILQLDFMLSRSCHRILHAQQSTRTSTHRYLQQFVEHTQRWQLRVQHSTWKTQRKHQRITRKRRLAGKLVGSEARIFVVAAMLDIGRISVRGSIKAHSSIYRRHQRSARTKPALLCLVPEHWSSEFWLAMADCLGRFVRASHSTSRYHTPPRSWDKSTMHVQCESLKSWQCALCSAVPLRSCTTILRLRSSKSLQYMRHSLCICPSNVTRHGVREE